MNGYCIRIAAVMAYCSALSAAAINTSVKTKRDSSAAPISRVCIVTVDARLSRVGMKGVEPLVPEGEEWARKMRDMVTHAVSSAGWTLAADTSGDAATLDEKVREPLLMLRQKYDTLGMQLKKKPSKVQQGRYSLGDDVALLPCSADADSLLFVHATGLVQTGGRKAFSVLIGGSVGVLLAQSSYQISIGYVDARTGKVTAFTRLAFMGGKAGTDPEKVITARLVEEFGKMQPAPTKRD